MRKHLSPNAQVIFICQRLHEKGLVGAYGGNVSVRTGSNIIITPKHSRLVDLSEDDLVVVGMDGEAHFGVNEPSSEMALHLAVYRSRPDVGGVVHTHPTASTAFAFVGQTIEAVNPESQRNTPNVPIVPENPVDSPEMARELSNALQKSDVCLLSKHGLLCTGENLREAFTRTELVEQTAMINLYVRILRGQA